MARVLVLDDEVKIRTLVRRVLDRMGHDVEEAEDGPQALLTLREGRFDLLITDMHMPRMTGSDVIAEARKFCPELRIVLMSGSSRESGLDLCGASVVLEKPFGVPELMAAVEGVLP